MCNMSASRKNIFFPVILMIIIYENVEAFIAAEPPSSSIQQQPQQEHNARSFRNALNQQGIQSLLQSIENRLGNLDQIYSNRYSQRVDLSTDQYVRKIEMLESKLTRLESTLDAQLEKLSENLSSKNFRDDITKDQIFRKIDSLYERFNHKLTYIEEKFEFAFLKMQNIIDIGVTKIERSENSINLKHADMESKISEGVQIIKTVKSNINALEEEMINVTRISLQNLEKIDATNIAKSLSSIENKFVNISSQNRDECLNNFTKKEPSYKINNMYNELWKKSNTIESSIKNSIELMNLTRKEIQDIKQKTTNPNNQNDDTQRFFSDLGRKMEDNFKNIMATQNLFLDSCKRIQMDETQLETKISSVLEELLDFVTNRNLVNLKELQNTEEIIKAQSYNVERLINQNTNTVMKLSEKTSEDRKEIEKILSTIKKDFANFMTTIEHEINLESLERSNVGNLILELQAQVNDLDRKMNKNNMNYNAKQMLQDDDDDDDNDADNVLHQTKDIFAKHLNISALHNTINKVDDSVKVIRQLLYDINIKINKYVDVRKLNATQINFDYDAKTANAKPTDENVDIVLGESDKNTTQPNIHLFRFNYSVIDDYNRNKESLMVPEASTIGPPKEMINSDVSETNKLSSTSSPLWPKMNTNSTSINDTDQDWFKILFSFKENNDSKFQETNSTKDDKILLEKSHYDEENKKKINCTNNIISIDNNPENLKNEETPATETFTVKYENMQQNNDTSEEYFSYEYDTGDQYPDPNI